VLVVTPVLVGRCRSQLVLEVLAVLVVQSPCLLEAVPVVLAAQSQLLLVQQVQTRVREVLLQSLLVQALAVVLPLVERLN
jgi:cytochrome c biogenesis protein CcdA